MKEHQKEAIYLSEFYRQIADDIEWYANKSKQIEEVGEVSSVVMKYFPKKMVICGNTTEDAKEYHLQLVESCRKATGRQEKFRRNYGFILDVKGLKENCFIKKQEYIEFDNMEEYIDSAHLMEIPEGMYVSCIVQVEKGKADFSALNKWLEEKEIIPLYVLAEEKGLQLFEYLDQRHPCEVRVFVK